MPTPGKSEKMAENNRLIEDRADRPACATDGDGVSVPGSYCPPAVALLSSLVPRKRLESMGEKPLRGLRRQSVVNIRSLQSR